MTFKEQMESQSAKRYKDHSVPDTAAFISGSHAALTSDLVKGLVDAGDKILEWWRQDDETGVLNADDVMDALNAALTNYKQEVKQ